MEERMEERIEERIEEKKLLLLSVDRVEGSLYEPLVIKVECGGDKSGRILYGQKKGFSKSEVEVLKGLLRSRGMLRDLALLSVGLDTMLRSGDLLKLLVGDIVSQSGELRKEISLRQEKTGVVHVVELSQASREVLYKYLGGREGLKLEDKVFVGLNGGSKGLSSRRFRGLVKEWARELGLDAREYSTHSLRRSRAGYIYKETGNIEVVRILLGQKSLSATRHYLNISEGEALMIGRKYML